jgi:hypothetical protein
MVAEEGRSYRASVCEMGEVEEGAEIGWLLVVRGILFVRQSRSSRSSCLRQSRCRRWVHSGFCYGCGGGVVRR